MTSSRGAVAGERAGRRLTWDRALKWRAGRHGLEQRVPVDRALDVVGRVAGLHAQVMSAAEQALWARVEGLDQGWLASALWDERSLLKTWAMRGTLHVLPSSDYPVWQAALGTYRHYLKPAWFRYFGVSHEDLEHLLAAVGESLDGEPLTREELAAEVERRTGSPDLGHKVRDSWGALLKPAAFRGHLCFAPGVGSQVRFTRPDRWLGNGVPADADEAMLEVTRRYLGAYGPATGADLGRWWGVSAAQAQKLLAQAGERVDLDGTAAWMLAEHLREAAEAAPTGTVRLLPAFDPYVVGASREQPALLAPEFRDRVYRAQGWISPVLLVDGRLAGVWRPGRTGSRVDIRIEPFQPVSTTMAAAAESEAERLAAWLGGTLTVSWSD